MKKTKLMMPILGIAAIGSAIAPLTTITSCSQKDINKVSLTETSSKEKTFSDLTKSTVFYFKQENPKDALDTKVKATNFKINGVDQKIWDKTIKFVVDSGFNIAVYVNVGQIIQSMSNTVETITFDLVFTNKTANTSYTLTDFTINLFASPKDPIEIAEDGSDILYKSISSTETGAVSTAILAAPNGKYMPASIVLTDANEKTLTPGVDYAYYVCGNIAYITIISYQEGLVASGNSTDKKIDYGKIRDGISYTDFDLADPTSFLTSVNSDPQVIFGLENAYFGSAQATGSIYSLTTGTTYEGFINGGLMSYYKKSGKACTELANSCGFIYTFTDKTVTPNVTNSFYFYTIATAPAPEKK